ncbi:MAG: tyrosine-type recombinase/integrase [Clostridia bacterium]|nr:tyrosine-type recombinase/integrase [Clostridia bacterium]
MPITDKNQQFSYEHRDYPNIIPTEYTLEEWLREWAPRRARGLDGCSQKEIMQRLSCVTNLIGNIPLQCLTLENIQNSVNELQRQEKSTSTIRYAYSFFLTNALNDAVRRHYLAFNPCMGMVLPKYRTPHRVGLTDDELKEFIRLSENTDSSLFFRTMIAAALRFGEVQALSWRQIDFERESVLIDQQITLRECEDEVRRYTLVPYTKYRKKQTVYPIKDIFPFLLEEKKRQQSIFTKQNCSWDENAYIFPGAEKPSFRLRVNRDFHIIATAINRPDLHPHDLRHTGARLKLKASNNIWEVRDLLRHSRLGTTVNYLYATPDDMREAVQKLDNWYTACVAEAQKSLSVEQSNF